MSLELLFLGTGTSAGVPMIGCACPVCRSDDPRDQRSRSSVLISYFEPGATAAPMPPYQPNGRASDVTPRDVAHIAPTPEGLRRLLIDTAPELRLQMVREHIGRIDGVFHTHAHADHIFGLDDLRRFNAVMNQPLDLYSERETLNILKTAFWYIFEPHRNINQSFVASLTPREIQAGVGLDLFGARWTPLRLLHGRLPILGFRVDYPLPSPSGRGCRVPATGEGACDATSAIVMPSAQSPTVSLAYCTDLSAIPHDSHAYLANLDVLVIDALRYTPHPTHLSIAQALKIVEVLKPKRTYFTHLAHDSAHAELERDLPAHVRPAYDGLKVTLTATGITPA